MTHPAPPDLCTTSFCELCLAYNSDLARQVLSLETSKLATRTHYFAGRYENIYIPADKITPVSHVLDTALQHAAEILGVDKNVLSIGFWFNIMRQGDVTLSHTHDDDDELLSGTYYISVPDSSSQLVLNINGNKRFIDPKEGMFVFFHPATPHEVTENLSTEPRISIGFNIGIKRDQESSL